MTCWVSSFTPDTIGDYHRRVAGLGARAERAYFHLTLRIKDHGPVPMDIRIVAPIAGCGPKYWETRIWPAIGHLFEEREGLLCHPDIEEAGLTPRQIAARHAAVTRHQKARDARSQFTLAVDNDRTGSASPPHAAAHQDSTAESVPESATLSEIGAAVAAAAQAPGMPGASASHGPVTSGAPAPARSHSLSSSDSDKDSDLPGESRRGSGGGPRTASADAETLRSAADAASPQPTQPPSAQDRRTRSAQPITRDWQPLPGVVEWVTGLGLNPATEVAKFVNHYLGESAPRNVSPNWDARFRKWIIGAVERQPPRGQLGMVMGVTGGSSAPSSSNSSSELRSPAEGEFLARRDVLAAKWRDKGLPNWLWPPTLHHFRQDPEKATAILTEYEIWDRSGRPEPKPDGWNRARDWRDRFVGTWLDETEHANKVA